MAKYVDTFYRVANRAYLYNGDIVYTGDTLMLALLFHCKGKSRNLDAEREIGKLLDDPNQKVRAKARA